MRPCRNSRKPSSSKEWFTCLHRSVSEHHGDQHSSLVGLVFLYRARTPGVEAGDNSTVLLDLNNSPQPDVVLFIEPEHGGQVKLDEKGYIVGAPELVAEVAASTVSYDLHDKLRAYERNGVREYIVWRVLEREVDWFVLRERSLREARSGGRRHPPQHGLPGTVARPRPRSSVRISTDCSKCSKAVSTPPNTPNSWPACEKKQRSKS